MKSHIIRNQHYYKSSFTNTKYKKNKDEGLVAQCNIRRFDDVGFDDCVLENGIFNDNCNCLKFGNYPMKPYPKQIIDRAHYNNKEIATFEFNDVSYDNCVFKNGEFDNIEFNKVIAINTLYNINNFISCRFNDSGFRNCMFHNANISNAYFRGCYFENVTFVDVDFNETKFDKCYFKNCNFFNCNIEMQKNADTNMIHIMGFNENCIMEDDVCFANVVEHGNDMLVVGMCICDDKIIDISHVSTYYDINKE